MRLIAGFGFEDLDLLRLELLIAVDNVASRPEPTDDSPPHERCRDVHVQPVTAHQEKGCKRQRNQVQ